MKDNADITLIQVLKIIIAEEFESERKKNRGDATTHTGDALTVIEMNVKKNLDILVQSTRLTREHLYEIYPHLRLVEKKEEATQPVNS